MTETSEMTQVKVFIPKRMMEQFDTLHLDPVTGKPRYGARSEVFRTILARYLEQQMQKRSQPVTEIFKEE